MPATMASPRNEGAAQAGPPPRLAVRNLSKRFPGQVALDGVDLALAPGRIHGLVGQNGSGKSTLIKILAGFHEPDPGSSAFIDGDELRLGSAAAADGAGVRFIHQDLGLVPTLSAVDNLALGHGYGSKL
jgi:ribose transport system ATP-binding protein